MKTSELQKLVREEVENPSLMRDELDILEKHDFLNAIFEQMQYDLLKRIDEFEHDVQIIENEYSHTNKFSYRGINLRLQLKRLKHKIKALKASVLLEF